MTYLIALSRRTQVIILVAVIVSIAMAYRIWEGGTASVVFWVLLMLAAVSWAIWMLGREFVSNQLGGAVDQSRVLSRDEHPGPVREVMDVEHAMEEDGIFIFRGRLRGSASTAYEKLKSAFSDMNVPLVQEDEELGAAITLIPKPEESISRRWTGAWIHWSLFGMTLLTTTWIGATHQGVDLLAEPGRFMAGVPYSVGLLGILGVHELGHYFMARRHGMQVTPPYFIPIPFALGTFGAFIQMRSPAENRRMLFDVAVAGPLAGLAIAIPALIIGLQSSSVDTSVVGAAMPSVNNTFLGSSLLFALISKITLGDSLQMNSMVGLSPLAFAGWLGLLVTALNLLPIGQLDGGHIVRAMFGRRIGNIVSKTSMWSLILLAVFVWPSLIVWAVVVFFVAGRGTPPLNDLTSLTPGRTWLGYAAFIILASILVPLPQLFE